MLGTRSGCPQELVLNEESLDFPVSDLQTARKIKFHLPLCQAAFQSHFITAVNTKIFIFLARLILCSTIIMTAINTFVLFLHLQLVPILGETELKGSCFYLLLT